MLLSHCALISVVSCCCCFQVSHHYTREIIGAVIRLLGSAGIIGDPLRNLHYLGLGVLQFVAGPTAGLVQSVRGHGPRRFAEGVAQGTNALLRSALFAASNATSKFSVAARKVETLFVLAILLRVLLIHLSFSPVSSFATRPPPATYFAPSTFCTCYLLSASIATLPASIRPPGNWSFPPLTAVFNRTASVLPHDNVLQSAGPDGPRSGVGAGTVQQAHRSLEFQPDLGRNARSCRSVAREWRP